MSGGEPEEGESAGAGASRSARETGRIAAAGVALVVVVVFAVLNTSRVKVDWIVTTTRTPLIVVIVGCLAIGFLLGMGVAHVGARRRRADAAS